LVWLSALDATSEADCTREAAALAMRLLVGALAAGTTASFAITAAIVSLASEAAGAGSLLPSVSTRYVRPPMVVISSGSPSRFGIRPKTAFSTKVMTACWPGCACSGLPTNDQLPSACSMARACSSRIGWPSGAWIVIAPSATERSAFASLIWISWRVDAPRDTGAASEYVNNWPRSANPPTDETATGRGVATAVTDFGVAAWLRAATPSPLSLHPQTTAAIATANKTLRIAHPCGKGAH
jgi:hypothetical protein